MGQPAVQPKCLRFEHECFGASHHPVSTGAVSMSVPLSMIKIQFVVNGYYLEISRMTVPVYDSDR